MRSEWRDHAGSARKTAFGSRAPLLASAALTLCVSFAARVQAQPGPQAPPPGQVSQLVERLRAAPHDVRQLEAARAVGFDLVITARYEEALAVFEAIIKAAPKEQRSLYGAALALFNLKRVEESERVARAAVGAGEEMAAGAADRAEADRLTSDALTLLAVVLAVEGRREESLAAVTRAVELSPRSFDARLAHGRALYGAGDLAAAAQAFRAAAALRPDDLRSRFFLATALEGAGDEEGALKTYREIVALNPDFPEGHLGLGVLLVKRGDKLEEGIEELKRVLSMNGDIYEARVTLGRALVRAGRAAEAVEHLKRAAELAPKNPEPHYQLAIAYRRLGRRGEAEAANAVVRELHAARRGADTKTGPNNSSTGRPNRREH